MKTGNVYFLVLLCRYYHSFISIPCFVPQHSISIHSLPYQHQHPT
ncbi:MAG: hypothetical protein QMB99_10015 [Paludibacteraceae bacterium]